MCVPTYKWPRSIPITVICVRGTMKKKKKTPGTAVNIIRNKNRRHRRRATIAMVFAVCVLKWHGWSVTAIPRGPCCPYCLPRRVRKMAPPATVLRRPHPRQRNPADRCTGSTVVRWRGGRITVSGRERPCVRLGCGSRGGPNPSRHASFSRNIAKTVRRTEEKKS